MVQTNANRSIPMTMKSVLLATALTLGATSAFAAEKYVLDASHSQIVFTYNHLGFSTTTSMFSGFDGEIMLDESPRTPLSPYPSRSKI